jgi:hypothetical protein
LRDFGTTGDLVIIGHDWEPAIMPCSKRLRLAQTLDGGTGQVTLVKQDDLPVAVFKPRSGENNLAHAVTDAVPGGTSFVREHAAFLLDPSLVPPVVQAHVSGSCDDVGSLAAWVPNDGPSWECGPERFGIGDVHRIACFDVRTLNLDRNGGNLLITSSHEDASSIGQRRLVPIDHGLILPERMDYAELEWVFWPQASTPFTCEELDYIDSLDAERDIQMLSATLPKSHLLSEKALRSLAIGTTWLKVCAANGLNLSQIGEAILRPTLSKPSKLEQLVSEAEAAEAAACWSCGCTHHDSCSDGNEMTMELAVLSTPASRRKQLVFSLTEAALRWIKTLA